MGNPSGQPELTITIDGREVPADEVLDAELQRGLAALDWLSSACSGQAGETADQLRPRHVPSCRVHSDPCHGARPSGLGGGLVTSPPAPRMAENRQMAQIRW